jgi:hypothetical protein
LFCQVRQSAKLGDNNSQGEEDIEFILYAIIYGPGSISKDVRDWLTNYGLFLQDLIHCDRNVLYQNPYLFYKDNNKPVITFSLKLYTLIVYAKTLKVTPNLFEILNQEH